LWNLRSHQNAKLYNFVQRYTALQSRRQSSSGEFFSMPRYSPRFYNLHVVTLWAVSISFRASLFLQNAQASWLVSSVRTYVSFSKHSKPYSLQTTDYEMIRVEGVRVWRCAGGLLAIKRTPGLLLICVTYCSTAIQRPYACSFPSGVHWASTLCECCMMGSNNSLFTTKSYVCASVAFLVGIIFWFVDGMWTGMIYLSNYINWMVQNNVYIQRRYSRYMSS